MSTEAQLAARELKTIVNATASQAHELTVDSAESEIAAVEFLAQSARVKKDAEARRKRATKPLNESLKVINSWFKQVTEPLDEARAIVEPKIMAWRKLEQERVAAEQAERDRIANEQRRAAEELQRQQAEEARLKAEAAARAANLANTEADRAEAQRLADQAALAQRVAAEPIIESVAPAVEQIANVTRGFNGSASTAKVWDFAIEDASKVPSAYLVVDEKKVRAAVQAGVHEIPGVRIWPDERLRVTAARA